MSIASDIQKLEAGSIIELFELDTTIVGGDILRFHAGTNELVQNVVWQGNEYTRYPVVATGFDYDGSGQFPRPKLQVSNVLSAITALVMLYNDLLGSKLTRKRTLKKYLDAVNFAAGNADADPDAFFADDIFYVSRKVSENKNLVEFELTTSFDLQGVQIPRRQVIQNVCPWKYRGAECSYAGTDYFTAADVATVESTQDVCGKRLSSCKARFGATAVLPFGGFPGADLIK